MFLPASSFMIKHKYKLIARVGHMSLVNITFFSNLPLFVSCLFTPDNFTAKTAGSLSAFLRVASTDNTGQKHGFTDSFHLRGDMKTDRNAARHWLRGRLTSVQAKLHIHSIRKRPHTVVL